MANPISWDDDFTATRFNVDTANDIVAAEEVLHGKLPKHNVMSTETTSKAWDRGLEILIDCDAGAWQLRSVDGVIKVFPI